MHPSRLKIVVLLLGVALVAVWPAFAEESPFAGNWKVLDVSSGNETALALLQITEKDGQPQAKVLAAPLLGEDTSIENLKVDGKSMRFDLKSTQGTFHVIAYRPKAGAVRGTIAVNGSLRLARFNKTDDKELSADDAEAATAEGELLAKALELENALEKQTALEEIVEKQGDNSAIYLAAERLLQIYAKQGAKEELLRRTAEKIIRIGTLFGPEIEGRSIGRAARTLLHTEKGLPLATEFVRRAEKSLTKDDPPGRAVPILKASAQLLRRAGKADEARKLETRIDKLEEPDDAAFLKTAVPFEVTPFKGRRLATRVAVVELFTGASCPPCVAADIAFDAGLQTYQPKDVVFLQYHLHIPRPDRLANADTEKRAKYYERFIEGVPTALINGKAASALGGARDDGNKSYETLCGDLRSALDLEGGGLLRLEVTRQGERLDLNAEVTHLKMPGEKVKLRFVLLEDVVRYPSGNGQRLHHRVVRAFPGGADGFALTDTRTRRKVAINLAELRTSLDDYQLARAQSEQPFLDDEYPLNLKHFKVVALIQDDDDKQILQAVQTDVPKLKE